LKQLVSALESIHTGPGPGSHFEAASSIRRRAKTPVLTLSSRTVTDVVDRQVLSLFAETSLPQHNLFVAHVIVPASWFTDKPHDWACSVTLHVSKTGREYVSSFTMLHNETVSSANIIDYGNVRLSSPMMQSEENADTALHHIAPDLRKVVCRGAHILSDDVLALVELNHHVSSVGAVIG
jgi:hypothetical protein